MPVMVTGLSDFFEDSCPIKNCDRQIMETRDRKILRFHFLQDLLTSASYFIDNERANIHSTDLPISVAAVHLSIITFTYSPFL